MMYRFFLYTSLFLAQINILQEPCFALFFQKTEQTLNIETARGNVKVQLYNSQQHELVQYFLDAMQTGVYAGTIFHRIIEGFIIQGGCYNSQFQLKETPHLKVSSSLPHSNLPHQYGSFAIILDKNHKPLSCPQYFINLSQNLDLNKSGDDFEFEVIGNVTSGMDLLEKISHTKIGQRENMHQVPFYPQEAAVKKMSLFVSK